MSEWTDEQLRAAAFAVMLDYSDNRANLHVGHRLLTLEAEVAHATAINAELRSMADASRENASNLAAEVARERNRADTAEREDNECHELNVRLSNLLTGVANALKGKPEPLHSHDWSDLPDVAAALKSAVDAYRAEGK